MSPRTAQWLTRIVAFVILLVGCFLETHWGLAWWQAVIINLLIIGFVGTDMIADEFKKIANERLDR